MAGCQFVEKLRIPFCFRYQAELSHQGIKISFDLPGFHLCRTFQFYFCFVLNDIIGFSVAQYTDQRHGNQGEQQKT